MTEPLEPPRTQWDLPDPRFVEGEEELIALGADLAPGTMLAGYRRGIFPMDVSLPDGTEQLGWWSPDPRAVLRPDQIHISRSMRRVVPRFAYSVDQAFGEVVRGCADPRRPHGWVNDSFVNAYHRLFDLGWAHSIEVWETSGPGTRVLAGGLFGIQIGRLFAAESKFHSRPNASKAAVIMLAQVLAAGTGQGRDNDQVDPLIEVQWPTTHLLSLGVSMMSREDYLDALPTLVGAPRIPLASTMKRLLASAPDATTRTEPDSHR